MSQYLGAKCKLCRRAGAKLFLKGERCLSSKCAIVKRNYPPGQHGGERQGRLSEYGLQLRTKQKLKQMYGLREAQFLNTFQKAERLRGNTAAHLMRLLEQRLDTIVLRGGFASSRAQARQLVQHGHFLVNDKKVNIPSYQTKVGDTITVSQTKTNKTFWKDRSARSTSEVRELEIPQWLSSDLAQGVMKILTEPETQQLADNMNISLIVEFYSK
ncbi:MAG: 30S ribosomal protein S4 [Candidatus Kerfeldbacteria bacterium RIFCSPHIGHO2_02_FULL_42_14]|uniref:Small ribosomal subunit protein uS4 n=1 Tax=Candidatus Kerfeldbacteria bacterium RIFCSPHIGHO2_02_FULL_42_14 TaxID=1798540 RepID=A0A1G2AR39_9BACT|nr:MAG: 30S ribosomal protein S4 [Candidatus Kerfeldbacteria bacterium RIFCSPHIGHO2_02_FULL_42_14]OGY80630.1 MAG: 30S ribosomal protein S4 [Candidatus Kerfeldbacteria bacterium RIFCSPHIGHO2_12_FULL_42_13]OGY82554.1 MAG: 30S ribosomal protein S4 [Candidatus Kerfeldbacteria bacterium RIFCSPLOWO2_02_FULL_42_19]OGY85158.1 MAG: 30S ribosomal protein S4 [Candidatus Kerfeldbacteria bacterium RIFCSPLOWO2_12_FULL_43_9]